MKIAFLLNSRVPSEDAHVLQSIRMCEAFAANGHDVVLHYPNRMQTNSELRGVSIASYYDLDYDFETRSYYYPDLNLVRSLFGLDPTEQSVVSRAMFTIYLPLKLRFGDADLYYTRGCYLAAFLVFLGIPTIFETHRRAHGILCNRFIRWMGRRRPLLGVVTLTEATAEHLQNLRVPPDRVLVVPDGVKIEDYNEPLSQGEARDRLGLIQDEFIVGYTGSLDRGKGVHDLVRATANLDVTVLIVGGRHERSRDAFRDYLNNEGIDNVRLVGHVPPKDVPIYQWASDVLVLPARSDVQSESHHPLSTSPLKLFEYMAAGRPIVATRLPGVEAILTDGEDSILTPPEDYDAMKAAITEVMDNPEWSLALASTAVREVSSYRWPARAKTIISNIHP